MAFGADGVCTFNVSLDKAGVDNPATTLDTNGYEVTLSGAILDDANGSSSSLSIEKTGAGKLTLSGTNTYTGDTTVSAGTLRAANANALGNSQNAIEVKEDATLELGFSGDYSRRVTGAGGGAYLLTPGMATSSPCQESMIMRVPPQY